MKFALSAFCVAAVFCLLLAPGSVRAATAVDAATAASIDTDADGVPDLFFSSGYGNSFDNAPSFNNPSQQDSDGDQYGDVIDPTPLVPGPVVDIGFTTVVGPYNVAPGAGVTINFTTSASPPGNFGHINMYFQNPTPEAYAFQSLATPGGSVFIPANLITIPGIWDLNTPGTYNVELWGLAPGEIAGYKGGIATVNVVPEPTSLTLLAACALLLFFAGRTRGKIRNIAAIEFAILIGFALVPGSVSAATAVDAATAGSIDSDSDGVPDLTDNSPTFNNPSQADFDGDGYGDASDPTPTTPGPVVNMNFQLAAGPYVTTPGAGISINYTTANSPVGNFGYISLFFQYPNPAEAYAFQSLAAPGGSFFIPANLVTIPGVWDLNTPGTYTVLGYGNAPGMTQGYDGGTVQVTVVPELSSLTLLASAGFAALLFRRLR